MFVIRCPLLNQSWLHEEMSGHSVLSSPCESRAGVSHCPVTAGLDNGHWGLKMRDWKMETRKQGLEIGDLRLDSKSQGTFEIFTVTVT